MFYPEKTNIYHSNYSKYSWWTKDLVEKMICRWHSQGGVDYIHMEPYMIKHFEYTLEKIGDEVESMYNKIWKTMDENTEKQRENNLKNDNK